MTNTISKFVGITVNGKDFSDANVVRSFANEWSVNADRTEDSNLFWIASSLFDIVDKVQGITEAISNYLSKPENMDDDEYSDIFKDMYGYRPF